MIHGSLFSGIGGFDLAADWIGWQNILQVENDQFCQQVLQYYWPDADLHGDIKKTDFSSYAGQIDIITGGFPCQPYSTAGKRKGTADERNQWPQMLRAVREIKPCIVLGENVPGLLSWNGGLVFEQVCADLEAEGYEVQPLLLPAAGLNAPHRRERTWFVAYAQQQFEWQKVVFAADCEYEEWDEDGECPICPVCAEYYSECECPGPTQDDLFEYEEFQGELWARQKTFTKTKQQGLEGADRQQLDGAGQFAERVNTNPGNAGSQGRQLNGTPDPETQRERQQPSGSAAKLYQNENWQHFPVESPLCSGNDGLPAQLDGITFPKWRKESIKGYGNAIVPQVAYQVFRAIEETIESS